MPIAGLSEFEQVAIKPIRLMGEDLVLYRDLSGGFGLIGRHCAHRRADLVHGMVEAQGLRCAYHGWCYGASGAWHSLKPWACPRRITPGPWRVSPLWMPARRARMPRPAWRLQP